MVQRRSHRHYWTKDEILATLGEFAEEHGRSPRLGDFRAKGSAPNAETICRRFGSWNAAVTAAGLPIFEPERITPDQVIAAIRAWNEKHGQPPSWHDWRIAGPDHMSAGTAAAAFGGVWNNAVTAAGLTPRFPPHYTRRGREKVEDCGVEASNGSPPARKPDNKKRAARKDQAAREERTLEVRHEQGNPRAGS